MLSNFGHFSFLAIINSELKKLIYLQYMPLKKYILINI